MLTIYRVLSIHYDGRESHGRSFLDDGKAQEYAASWRKLNKLDTIVVRVETAHQ